jgi:hypothetical protein
MVAWSNVSVVRKSLASIERDSARIAEKLAPRDAAAAMPRLAAPLIQERRVSFVWSDKEPPARCVGLKLDSSALKVHAQVAFVNRRRLCRAPCYFQVVNDSASVLATVRSKRHMRHKPPESELSVWLTGRKFGTGSPGIGVEPEKGDPCEVASV